MTNKQSSSNPNGHLRVGLAGAGMISLYHMRGWQEVGGAEVVAICDPSQENAEMRAKEFGVSNVYQDAAEMLDACSLDAIDVAASVQAHAPLVRLAADRGLGHASPAPSRRGNPGPIVRDRSGNVACWRSPAPAPPERDQPLPEPGRPPRPLEWTPGGRRATPEPTERSSSGPPGRLLSVRTSGLAPIGRCELGTG